MISLNDGMQVAPREVLNDPYQNHRVSRDVATLPPAVITTNTHVSIPLPSSAQHACSTLHVLEAQEASRCTHAAGELACPADRTAVVPWGIDRSRRHRAELRRSRESARGAQWILVLSGDQHFGGVFHLFKDGEPARDMRGLRALARELPELSLLPRRSYSAGRGWDSLRKRLHLLECSAKLVVPDRLPVRQPRKRLQEHGLCSVLSGRHATLHARCGRPDMLPPRLPRIPHQLGQAAPLRRQSDQPWHRE